MQSLSLMSDDGPRLAACYFAPQGEVRGAVLIGDSSSESFSTFGMSSCLALSITDDELMTERGTQVLIDCYANTPRRIERIAPRQAQVRRIGHFGFFHEQFRTTLWQRSLVLLHGFGTPLEDIP